MKRMIVICCLSIVPLYADITSSWSYSTAAASALQGNWTDAQKQLNQLLVNAPDSPDILYDSGVAAYRLCEFEKAAAYFQQVATLAHEETNLKKQAHFNLGNTKVAMNELSDAIGHYEEVLAIEPDNEPAQHNLAKVKEMLQQQQKQQQQQKNNKQDKDNNERDQQKDEQSANNDQNQNQQESQNQNSSESSRDNQNANNQEQQHNKSNSAKKGSDQNQQQQSMSGGDQKEKKDETDNQQEGNKQNEPNHEPNQQNRNNKQNKLNNSHTSASDQHKEQQEQKRQSKNASHPTKNERKEQAMQTGVASDTRQEDMRSLEQELGSHERWMARVLDRQEKADATAQKILIKTNINKQLAGNDGQNCW